VWTQTQIREAPATRIVDNSVCHRSNSLAEGNDLKNLHKVIVQVRLSGAPVSYSSLTSGDAMLG
jgi:hypothetical protein